MAHPEDLDALARSRLISSYFYELARWERAVAIQRDRLQQAVRAYLAFERGGTHQGESNFHMDVMMDAHFLFVAVAHLYFVSRRIRDLSGGSRVASAVAEFERELSDAKRLRDLFEHLGDYMEDKGRLDLPWPEGARFAMSDDPEVELALILESQSAEEETRAVQTASNALSLARSISTVWGSEDTVGESAAVDPTDGPEA
jgi:hypothetical protein